MSSMTTGWLQLNVFPEEHQVCISKIFILDSGNYKSFFKNKIDPKFILFRTLWNNCFRQILNCPAIDSWDCKHQKKKLDVKLMPELNHYIYERWIKWSKCWNVLHLYHREDKFKRHAYGHTLHQTYASSKILTDQKQKHKMLKVEERC